MLTVIRVILALAAVEQIVPGLLLLFAPGWFFENIGNFPPFNRHYMGDTGAFTLGLGLGLVFALRDPARYRGAIAAVAIGNLVHLANHLYDDYLGNAWSLDHFLRETLVLILVPLLLFGVYLALRSE
jgi:hypothetical protein